MKLSTRRDPSAGGPERWEAECARLFAAEVDLSRKRIALGTDLPSLIASAGEAKLLAHLEGEETTHPGQSVESVRAELSIIDAALGVARRKRYEALRQIHVAEASEMRTEAAKLRNQAAKHSEVTNRLLAELEVHEECRFVPEGPPSGDGLRLRPGTYRRPVSDRLNGQAAQLEADAEVRERRQLRDWENSRAPTLPTSSPRRSLNSVHSPWVRRSCNSTTGRRARCRRRVESA